MIQKEKLSLIFPVCEKTILSRTQIKQFIMHLRVFLKACWGLGLIIFYAFVSTYLWMMRWMRGLTLTRVVSLVGLGWWQWRSGWTIMIDVTTQIWFWAMIFGIKFLRPPVIICRVVPLAYNQQHTYNLCKSCFKRWIWCFTNSTSI